jgi:hypothetical protein
MLIAAKNENFSLLRGVINSSPPEFFIQVTLI